MNLNAKRPVVVAIGNSHLNAVRAASAAADSPVELKCLQFLTVAYAPHWTTNEGVKRPNRQFLDDARGSIEREKPVAVICFAASKAVLRVAAEQVSAGRVYVAYFPSFEIITGNHAGGRYFDADLRSVTAEGVAHVMRLFMRHYAGDAASAPAPVDSQYRAEIEALQQMEAGAAVICDEVALERA